jgi:purine-binding chemotaxis protein CheW
MFQQDEEQSLVSTFYLGEALFGISTDDVQEVVTRGKITPIHHAPDYISGVINLRGQIVTVIDLGRRLDMEKEDDQRADYICIVAWRGEHVGLIVDRMADVVAAELDKLAPLPENIPSARQKYFKGICQTAARPIAILDIDSVLGEEENEAASSGSR